jgi:hypothetical protein
MSYASWASKPYRAVVKPWLPPSIRRWVTAFFHEYVPSRLGSLRVTHLFTALLGYQYQRALRRIEIDITYACNLRCFNCDRSCTQAPSGEQMTVEQIELFVEESVRKGIKWERIRLLGGEPTLHPNFFEILERLISYRRSFSAETIIEVWTNGYGKKVEGVLRKMPSEIKVQNTNKSAGTQPRFHTFNVAPRDLIEFCSADFRNGCVVTQNCGIGLTPSGYYPCAAAGGIDRIVGWDLGRQRLPNDEDMMRDMLEKFCNHCGYFRRKRDAVTEPVISPTWKAAYEQYRHRKPKLTRYGSKSR